MAKAKRIARLRITPSGYFEPIVHTIILEQTESGYRVVVTGWNGLTQKRSRHRVDVDTLEVEQQLAELVQMTVPAFPVSPMVCDGEYVELQIEGGYSHLRIGWWSIAPKGAESVADFAYWLRDLGLGDDDDEDGDCEDEEN